MPRRNHQGDLTKNFTFCSLNQLCKAPTNHLFVGFRQLPAQRGLAIGAKDLSHENQGLMDAFGRFKKDQGVGILRKSLQIARCLAGFTRKESLKGKAIGGKSRQGQRGYGSRGPREDTDVDASYRGLVN